MGDAGLCAGSIVGMLGLVTKVQEEVNLVQEDMRVLLKTIELIELLKLPHHVRCPRTHPGRHDTHLAGH